jgi:hypothetical protein
LPLLNDYDPERKGGIGVSGNYERQVIMNTTRVHRYEKTKNALIAILKFNTESKSLYKWHNFGIILRVLYRSIEDCPGFFDASIREYCDEIFEVKEHTSEAMTKIKELAQKALDEIAWEEKTGNDLYPCIEL